jgi:mono/diheme cytochrome c family protein
MIRAALSGVFVFMATLSLAGQAGQMRSVTERVYTVAQATRGERIYRAQCSQCHGTALEGASGPPLVGEEFLGNWSSRTLTNLVDKIQKTMPFTSPGSLSRQQSMDLSAYILQSGKFPAGPAELADNGTGQIAFPATRTAATSSRPEGNLAELMRAIAFPNANIIFNTQLKDPGAQPKKELAKAPFDYVEWGSTVYPGWLAIDQAAIALTESAPLLLTPGRRCQNGRMAPVDRTDWKKYVADLIEVGKLAHEISQTRNYDAFQEISEKLNDACANCHKVYRDKGGTEGSGATRCQPSEEK